MKLKQTHLMYGLLTGLAFVIISALFVVLKVNPKSATQYIVYIPLFLGLIMNAQAYTKANDGYVTFGNVFGSCFKAALIVALLAVAWGVIADFVFPDMKERIIEQMAEEFEKKDTPEEQVEMILDSTRKYWLLGVIFGGFIWTLIMGIIGSLIAAAIPKKKGALPEHMQ